MSNSEENAKVTKCDNDEVVELTGHGRYHQLVLVACCIISNGVALDMFGFSIVVTAAACDLQLDIKQIGILASAPFAGVLFAFPWGYYADTGGRRRALLLSTTVGFIFAALSSFSTNWQMMLAFKIIGSSFSSSSFTLVMTYLGENIGSARRSRYLFIMNSMNLASEIVSFGLALFILPLTFHWSVPWLQITLRAWRLFTFIIAVPLGVGAVLLFYLYESPTFLANKGDTEETRKVLRKIFVFNGGDEKEFMIGHLNHSETIKLKEESIWQSLKKQTVPLFQPPLLWSTIQLFYLLVICCTTNNVFLMWYPTMVNLFFNSVSSGSEDMGFCEAVVQNITTDVNAENYVCDDSISLKTIYSGIALGFFFTIINLAASKLASWRRLVLMSCYLVAALSSILVGSLTEPIASMIFFILIQITAIGIGSVSSYFVDLYPTSHRSLVTCLAMMVARMTSFSGVNLLGAVVVSNCNFLFYSWAVFVLSGVAVAFCLPSDRTKSKNNCNNC
ncbi:PREDICTED: synaptic vesicle glycoprotein 2B-like [Papilio xuthus]|uniref:Synaptic vesicle glycoprotein 2B-like n=1 Tax=Papilio xuthus TaxID=66420 RepID=A0AAJ7E8W0_PAPXU|nr:PREDICTED: synaptic vesicle glycoprotein 2B-like [Papilio xuthus]